MLPGSAYLTLMIGPGIPLPAPLPVVEALESVQVTRSRDRSGFQLTFTVGKTSPIQLALLPAGFFDPITTRVIVVATVGGMPSVLMDGFVTRHDVQPSNDPGQSKLTVTGDDLTTAMDLVEVIMPQPAMPDAAQVALILGRYAFLGIVPLIIPPFIPTTTVPMEGHQTQLSTDLKRLRELAGRNGFVFYIEPGPLPGQSIGYFGPDIRLPVPQSALSVNFDGHTNVESLSLSLDGTQKRMEIITILDPVTNRVPIPVPMPDIDVFKPPLGARPLPPAKVVYDRTSAALPMDEAIRNAIGRGVRASQPITGSATLDVLRYGRPVRSRSLIGVRGAGLAYDGFYYVDSVTDNIKRGEYKQNLSLSRDGIGTNTMVVMP
jgi:hypothetical protein